MKTVIEMAREAGWKDLRDYDSEMRHDVFMGSTDSLARFAELARAEEREACAKVASGFYASDASNYPSHIAAAIRARGQA
jgi:hypothetical protein